MLGILSTIKIRMNNYNYYKCHKYLQLKLTLDVKYKQELARLSGGGFFLS